MPKPSRKPEKKESTIQILGDADNALVQAAASFWSEPDHIKKQLANAKDTKGRTILMLAALKGDLELARALLNSGADVNIQSNEKTTALMLAAEGEMVDMVRILIDAGADVNAQNNQGLTALMIAGSKSRTEIVDILFNNRADVNLKNRNYLTALILATSNGNIENVKALLNAGANPFEKDAEGTPPLLHAIRNKHTNIAITLLEHHLDANELYYSNSNDGTGTTALMLASDYGNNAVVEKLLAKGADTNIQDANRWTALMLAARSGHADVAKLLLATGADPNIQNRDGDTALMFASEKGQSKVVSLLLSHNADVDVKNFQYGSTALGMAVLNGRVNTILMLLAAKANPAIKDLENASVLNYMKSIQVISILGDAYFEILEKVNDVYEEESYWGSVDENGIRMFLKDENWNVNIGDIAGVTMLMRSVCLGSLDLVKAILKRGANVNDQDRNNVSALLYAVAVDGVPLSVVEALLENGANPELKNKDGYNAPFIARERRNSNLIKLFTRYELQQKRARAKEKTEISNVDEKDEKVEFVIKCKQCGEKLDSGIIVCPYCGHVDWGTIIVNIIIVLVCGIAVIYWIRSSTWRIIVGCLGGLFTLVLIGGVADVLRAKKGD